MTHQVTLRRAALTDVPILEHWDQDGDVIHATTDERDYPIAFGGVQWIDELRDDSDVSFHLIAEVDGRPIGAMQVIDPHLEPTHYWGDIEPNLRAVDIWIGDAADRSRGFGAQMMQQVHAQCFADPSVQGIVIDPLASNARAHRFYERLGYELVGPRVFGDDHCLVYRLDRATFEQMSRA